MQGIQSQYVTSELEFSGGKAWGRSGGRFAQYFVDDWNGKIAPDTSVKPRSSVYDIQVAVIDANTVSMKGLKTGETVTLTFVQPFGVPAYASDNPERKPYSSRDGYKPDCTGADSPSNWYSRFLAENRKTPLLLKKRVETPENGRFQGDFAPNHWFF